MVPGIGLDATFSHLAAPAGDIAFVSQSGAMISAMLDWVVLRGIGFSHVVSLGDMADVDFGDMLDYLAADPQTRAILLYMEGVTHARKFMSAARAASRVKPVLVLKAGRSNAGARAATSHTGVPSRRRRRLRCRVPPRRHAAGSDDGRTVRRSGNPGADPRAARRKTRDPVEVLSRVSQLAADNPEIRELDINPLLADAAGTIALDARVRIAPAQQPGAGRLAITPYPQDLETTEQLREGTILRVRPLRPEDEPLLHDLAAHMSPEDLRLRFFTPVRGLTHPVAARLSQLDYDREMALLAEGGGIALGVAHFFADPDRLRAEYAIAVRSDWKGRGVGFLLMTRLIAIASQWGIGELVGEVLRENEPMLRMCSELGFVITPDLSNPPLVLVRKRLVRCFQNNAPMSSGCIVDFVTPGVDDGLAIDVGNEGRQAFLEFVFGADADVAQDRTRQL
jgi:GNAT superfamily N-acetyltransferase